MLFVASYIFVPYPYFNAPIEQIENDGSIVYTPDNSYICFVDNSYYLCPKPDFIDIMGNPKEILLTEEIAKNMIKFDDFEVKQNYEKKDYEKQNK